MEELEMEMLVQYEEDNSTKLDMLAKMEADEEDFMEAQEASTEGEEDTNELVDILPEEVVVPVVTEGTAEVIDTVVNLRKEEIIQMQNRTNQLFEIIGMIIDNASEVQLCRNEIVELNIRLVPHVLKKYKPFGDDEFQLGCLGLIIASRTFDINRGVPFASYACFCIERELHKAHRHQRETFEFKARGVLESLDIPVSMENGDSANKYDFISDENAVADFEHLLEDFCLTDLFDNIISPSIEAIADKTKGQQTTVDFELWRALELRYLLELAEVDSQKARITFSGIAQELGVSVQNIRMRHQRVINCIRERCIELGIHI